MDDDDFRQRYGQWAVVAGASEGVGSAFALALAERGMDVVLLARRQAALEDVAAEIRAKTGREARVLAVDLATQGAVESIVDATADLEVGLFLYCAGADPNYRLFLKSPVEDAVSMVRRNCVVPMELCHHFAGPMVARGRGSIILLSSGAGLAGGRNMVAYSASKAFDMVMAEALWAELHDQGIDVLGLVLAATDTPALRRLLAQRGQLASEDDPSPIPGAVTADEVVQEALANLAEGPTWFAGDMARMAGDYVRTLTRNEAVQMMIDAGGGLMGSDPED